MSSREWMIVKSTIDYEVRQAVAAAATENGLTDLPVTEVEDATRFDEVLKSSAPAALYQLTRMSDNPTAPRYSASFNVGAKTTDDAGHYLLAGLLGAIQNRFAKGSTFPLHDYSDAALQGPRYGSLMIVDADVNPQQFDKQSGIRMLTCQAVVLCRGS